MIKATICIGGTPQRQRTAMMCTPAANEVRGLSDGTTGRRHKESVSGVGKRHDIIARVKKLLFRHRGK